MSDKKSKSVKVRLTEDEWLLLKQLTNDNSSDYLRQLWLKRLNKKIAVKLVYTFESDQNVLQNVLDNFEQNYGDDFSNLIEPENITKKQLKSGRYDIYKIVWSGKIDKRLLPELIRMKHHGEALYDQLPIENSHIEVHYRKESI